ncbi:hypothetical protein AB0I60_34670 [Actinosynnema sp. NPDC050436]|uniref:hypothetical protein n=1 Tax=Actinosynnema sp. NPDC050436 TaxID=3155659 RepID=UPI00340FF73C
MTTIDRSAGILLLRRLRESRGWSWSDLARAMLDTARRTSPATHSRLTLPSVLRSIARWESLNASTVPGDRYRLLLAHLYARTPIGEPALGPGTDFDVLLTALRHLGVPDDRVAAITDTVAHATSVEDPVLWLGTAACFHVHASPDDESIEQLTRSAAVVAAGIGVVSFVRLHLALAPAVRACRVLAGPASGHRPDRSLRVAADILAVAARIAFETRDDSASAALYNEALTAASRAADHSGAAAIRTSLAMVTLHRTDDPAVAQTIARAATHDAHRGPSHAIRARAHAVHAEILARASESDAAADALDRAHATLAQATADDPRASFNHDHLTGFDGLCTLHRGDPTRAHMLLDRTLTGLAGPRDTVQRGIVLTDLARARLRLGDPRACAELAHHVVELITPTAARVPTLRIRRLLRDLRPWRDQHFVHELHDHVHDTLLC